jgi:hypothetical protein
MPDFLICSQWTDEEIRHNEKNIKVEAWFGVIMFVLGYLTVFSFLPHKLAKRTLLMVILDTIIPLFIALLFILLRLNREVLMPI